MALRKPKPDEMAPPNTGRAATALAEPPSAGPGPSADECMATGQALVQAGQLDAEPLDEEVATRFPEEVARKHKVMPIADEGGMIVLYAADPSPARRQMVEQVTH